MYPQLEFVFILKSASETISANEMKLAIELMAARIGTDRLGELWFAGEKVESLMVFLRSFNNAFKGTPPTDYSKIDAGYCHFNDYLGMPLKGKAFQISLGFDDDAYCSPKTFETAL